MYFPRQIRALVGQSQALEFLADGTWLYMKLPKELRKPKLIGLNGIVDALFQANRPQPSDRYQTGGAYVFITEA